MMFNNDEENKGEDEDEDDCLANELLAQRQTLNGSRVRQEDDCIAAEIRA